MQRCIKVVGANRLGARGLGAKPFDLRPHQPTRPLDIGPVAFKLGTHDANAIGARHARWQLPVAASIALGVERLLTLLLLVHPRGVANAGAELIQVGFCAAESASTSLVEPCEVFTTGNKGRFKCSDFGNCKLTKREILDHGSRTTRRRHDLGMTSE